MPRLLSAMLFGIACLLTTAPAAAHPHIWVDGELALVSDNGTVTALDIVWHFDPFYSEMVRADFDLDGDGSLSQQELDALVGISAANLPLSSFFTRYEIDGERFSVGAVRQFFADDDGEKITYRFRVVLNETVDPTRDALVIGLFDDGYYVDIAVADRDIEVGLDPALGCALVPRQAMDEPLYFGLFYPTYLHLECAKHGQTAKSRLG